MKKHIQEKLLKYGGILHIPDGNYSLEPNTSIVAWALKHASKIEINENGSGGVTIIMAAKFKK